MLKIGDFSKLARVSIRMLRHYDEIGLLHPVHIDAINGYRYYEASQLITAGRITALREMGFGLAEISAFLAASDQPDQQQVLLLRRRQELEEEARQTAYRLASQTMAGTGMLQLATGAHPGARKDAVCSPAGSTIRGVAQLEKSGFRAAVLKAVDAILDKDN